MAQQSTAPTGPGQLPPETFGTHFEGALQYGVAQRRARKNEDRYCVVVAPTSTRKDGTQSPPWCDLLLAVFDGHNGWRAAEECVRALPKRISQRLAILEEEPGGKDVTDGPGWSTQVSSHTDASSVSVWRDPLRICRRVTHLPHWRCPRITASDAATVSRTFRRLAAR